MSNPFEQNQSRTFADSLPSTGSHSDGTGKDAMIRVCCEGGIRRDRATKTTIKTKKAPRGLRFLSAGSNHHSSNADGQHYM